MSDHYRKPGWFTREVLNRIVAGLTRSGIGVYGSRVLEVRGRSSGQWRRTPVNVLRYQGGDYLKRWGWEVGTFFDGVGARSSDRELRQIAGDHPVFRLESG